MFERKSELYIIYFLHSVSFYYDGKIDCWIFSKKKLKFVLYIYF